MLRITLPSQKQVSPVSAISRVAIIGGGFTGATLARLLALHGRYRPHEIVVFEARDHLGGGLAYDTDDPSLRLNVAAHRMRAVPGDPQAFVRWLSDSGRLEQDPGAVVSGAIYARRGDFAAFMAAQVQPFLDDGIVRHVREHVERIHRHRGRWQIEGDAGAMVQADVVVLATGHPAPTPPDVLAGLSGDPRFVRNLSRPDALHAIRPDDKVFVVGAGLTALDAVAALRNRGHCGDLTLFSRTGHLPQPQAAGDFAPHGDFLIGVPNTALSLLKQVRFAMQEVTQAGLPWQSVFDALRHQGQTIWRNLPLVEQRRVLRHLRRRFEAHRFRMPPQIAELVACERAAGRLRACAGQIIAVQPGRDQIAIDIATKPRGVIERHIVQRIMVATGPNHGNVIDSQGCLAELEHLGLLTKDPRGLGIACDADSRAVARDGYPVEDLFIAGPLARGTFGELTGVPEIAAQAERIVQQIVAMSFATTRTITIRPM
ncbi:hydroxyacylglutathione hydrolase [Sinorhizobium glycinis]|uniref:Hydroxyacylglutathione hydrolase n=1 Tax=Sinorhizobium glycinis TaxID=1472378 RepID=A0A178Y7G4_9HYPH|nr:FAD/NAD(P)-binding protein [Sinorhizobium glycinis]OAP42993.1 hydroxyacylglutathione hydrolase [Sinorhizobium glycinis]